MAPPLCLITKTPHLEEVAVVGGRNEAGMEQRALEHTFNGVVNWQLAAGLQTWLSVGFRAQRGGGVNMKRDANDQLALTSLVASWPLGRAGRQKMVPLLSANPEFLLFRWARLPADAMRAMTCPRTHL